MNCAGLSVTSVVVYFSAVCVYLTWLKAEELDDRKVQIVPPGFHVVFLPFADDFRKLKLAEELPRGELFRLFNCRNCLAIACRSPYVFIVLVSQFYICEGQ